MSAQTVWVSEPAPRERRGTGKPPPQSRILVLRMLTEAGPQGCPTEALVDALLKLGRTDGAARARLYRDMKAGLIFGRGEYLSKQGIVFRYFLTAEFAAGYDFGEAAFVQERKERRRELDRQRYRRKWQGAAEGVPPESAEARAHAYRAKERERGAARRAKERVAKIAAGETVYDGTSDRSYRRRGRPAVKRDALPGTAQVVVRVEVPAPVSVTKRPVLTGEPIITSATRVTVAPVPRDYRFWVDPATVRPVFGAMRLGVLLEGELV